MDSDKFLKIAAAVALLLAGGSVFYYYALYLPGIEQERAARASEEKDAAERQELARQNQYETCKANARSVYEADWANACKSVAQSRVVRLRSCLADKLVMNNPYMGENYCKSTFGDADPSHDCALPHNTAEGLNNSHKEADDKCLAEARLNL
ncbi:hypothetical protein [Ralstonia solanacearum]|uniref:hypothetical protein n=1 Tax=Ralstonia solanacearum TaxID=305 RepID=UPI0001817157|nr:hypothetical protein [Ralstonia solanacearum]MDC6178164.1 hypothetical protein [Ralstonia solanacearum]MDC6210716.1 hypothetical protein [Ralstonia solanacearum]MDC6239120.1 hypothetical protein [Ralstonia solanacearum]MDD7801064.1 hypothetical protein [Ralstonia solanacearum]